MEKLITPISKTNVSISNVNIDGIKDKIQALMSNVDTIKNIKWKAESCKQISLLLLELYKTEKNKIDFLISSKMYIQKSIELINWIKDATFTKNEYEDVLRDIVFIERQRIIQK